MTKINLTKLLEQNGIKTKDMSEKDIRMLAKELRNKNPTILEIADDRE